MQFSHSCTEFACIYISLYGNIQDPVIKAQVNLIAAVTICLYYSYFAVSIA